MAVSLAISDIFSVKEWPDLKILVKIGKGKGSGFIWRFYCCLCVLLTAYPFLDPGLNEKIFTDTAGSAMMDTPGKN